MLRVIYFLRYALNARVFFLQWNEIGRNQSLMSHVQPTFLHPLQFN